MVYPFQYSNLVLSVGDREKRLSIVFRREITKIRSFEAEQAQANKTTIFSEVSMTRNFEKRIEKSVIFLLSSVGRAHDC